MNKPTLSTFAQIRDLKPWQGLAFSLAVLSRMVPHVQLYQELQSEQMVTNAELAEPVDLGQLTHKVLGLLWANLANPKATFNYAVQLEKIESATPDMTADTPFGVFPAMDACLGLSSVLRMLKNEQDDAPVMVSKLAQGGIEAMLLETELAEQQMTVENIADEEERDGAYKAMSHSIKHHPLMEFEVAFQQHVITLVTTHKRNAQLDTLLHECIAETGITTLGIELE